MDATQAETDRFTLTLFAALALHTALLGISFKFQDPGQRPRETALEVTIVRHPKAVKAPDKADFLAQVSQEGGGNQEKAAKPTTELAPPTINPASRQKMHQESAGNPALAKVERRQVEAKNARKKTLNQHKPIKKTKRRGRISDLLASQSQEIKRLTAELDTKQRSYAKRPRRKHVSAATQEYQYAAYLQAWRRKIERVGTLHFPDEARRKGLYGNLVLQVSLNADGTIHEIALSRSSGHKILDDAAIRIVRLSAPFAPFPKQIADKVDILDITRTWQFVSGSNSLFMKR
jgi:protein TonB